MTQPSVFDTAKRLLQPMHDWTQNTTTQAEVNVFILDKAPRGHGRGV